MIPPALLFFASLVNDVRGLVARHDLGTADRIARSYQSQVGKTSELAAAISWMARGAVEAKQYDQAEKYADETRTMCNELLRTRRLDSDPWLPTALGASIEVHAEVLAARGERPEAIALLRKELALFGSTSIGERLRKNLNLLNLVGKPAPALDEREWLTNKPVPLASLKGHPVLLFFWAHWCSDCKAEGPIIASLMEKYGPKGLVVVAPTRLYGYVAGGMDAPPDIEKQYIDRVRHTFYPMLNTVATPLSATNFLEYGCSSTPTLVLLDSTGVVRYYHPGAATAEELSTQIRRIVSK